ncbi:MAG: TIR domain-containing protein [Ekhidna sp.]|nr:TIR domain-containing protein [Ekhidna sp.]
MEKKYDIALSFAGEQREYVDQVANLLEQKGISTFYDKAEEANLWGKNLYDHFSDIYLNQARYTIMFISSDYANKLWTNHERQAMQARAFQEISEYILPARFDNTKIPGVPTTISYIDLNNKSPEEFVEIIERKLISSGGTIPSENLRKALFTITSIPKVDPKEICVLISESDNPIQNAEVVLLADNGTTVRGFTNAEGKVNFEIKTRRSYTVIVSHSDYPSAFSYNYDSNEDLQINLNKVENIGSIVSHSTCNIPGLKGRLNPILDSSNRTYFYADNIAIDGGKQQPVPFSINEPIQVEDSDGVIMNLIFRVIKGSTAVIDYVKPVYEQ